MKAMLFIFSFLTSACIKNVELRNNTASSSYLALGDSYTIGESVAQAQSFPYQLQALLNQQKIDVSKPQIIATTGWTTDELQNAIKQHNNAQKYDLVTLLIGVNNQYRGYSLETYKKEFSELLQTAITFANGNKNHVFVISIPDWGVTPFGKNSGRATQTIADEIDVFNAAAEVIASTAGVSYTDITPGSRKARTDVSLIANDGLHPSGKMYAEWANILFTKIIAVLK